MPENKTFNARQTVEELVYAVGVAESEGQTGLSIFGGSTQGDAQRATTAIIDIARLDGDAGKAERFLAFLATVNELTARPAAG